MKKVIISLVVLLVVLSGSMFALKVIGEKNSLYNQATVATVDDVFTKKGKNIYYFYQETCHYCNNIKGEVTKFYNALNDKETNIEFNIVDMQDDANTGEWYSGDDYQNDPDYKSDPKDIKSLDDLDIVGTPTMVYVEDKTVKEYAVGPEVFELMNTLIRDNKLDITVDSSTYSK